MIRWGRWAVLLALLPAVLCTAEEPRFHLFESEGMRVVFLDPAHDYITPHLARCFHNSWNFHRSLLDYTPSEDVTILLQDFDDYGYAGATAMPLNYVTIGIEPFEYVYETSPTNERINWVMSHELLHVVASDQRAPRDRFFRRLFRGKVAATPETPLSMVYSYLTTPRMYAPRWYHEGMAVFLETWMSGGYGRALGGYDEMVFRTMVADGEYFYDTVGLESEGRTIDFQIGQVSYLYGTRFVSYLALHHGPAQVLEWLRRGDGTRASFRGQFRHVFGRGLDEEWRRWIEWEQAWQRANLERVEAFPVTEFEPLTDRPLGSASRSYYDPERRTLYTAMNEPGEFAQVVAVDVDTWEIRHIADVPTPALYYVTSLAWDPSSRTLYFTTDNSRDRRDLNAVSADGGPSRRLLRDIRVGDLVVNRADGTLWGVRHHNGLSTVVRIRPPHDEWEYIEDVHVLAYGTDVFDLDVSPDGRWLTAAMIEASGRQRLVRFEIPELLAGGAGYDVLWEFSGNSPANFVFSPDGRYLYGTSYYTGVANVFRYDLQAQTMDALTNARTGFFRPVPVSDDELIALHYTADGFVPVRLAIVPTEDVNAVRFLGQEIQDRHPEVREWMLPPPSAIDLDALRPRTRPYRAFRELGLVSAYPIVESYRGETAAGVRLDLMDPVGLVGMNLRVSASPSSDLPDDERLHAAFELRRWPWSLEATYNVADFYDFFGPTEVSRKGYSLGIGYQGILLADRPRRLEYRIRVAGYGGMDRLPEYQEVPVEIEDFLSATARLDYRSTRGTIGGLEPEKGVGLSLVAQDRYDGTEHFPRLQAMVERGLPLPIEHASLWLRGAAGYAFGDEASPFSRFYFGAFGNNWVDHGEVRRYRDPESFPGVEINEVGGRTFAKLGAEWRLPPLRFRRAGVPDAYLTWVSPAVFVIGLATDPDDVALRRELLSVGAQFDLKVVLFSNLSTTLSLGYARAFEHGRAGTGEVLVSLKIL